MVAVIVISGQYGFTRSRERERHRRFGGRNPEIRQTFPATRRIYQRLLRQGTLDQCGVTLLAGRAVGAPFVCTAAAALAIAEILRLLHGGRLYELVDADLISVEHRTVVAHPFDFSKLNPGYVPAKQP